MIFTSGTIKFRLELNPHARGTWIDVMTLPGESKEHAFAKLAAEYNAWLAENEAARAARGVEKAPCL
jgi:hypothetical protein